MKPEEVARLDENFALVLRTRDMPVKLHKVKWYADPTFVDRHARQTGQLTYPQPREQQRSADPSASCDETPSAPPGETPKVTAEPKQPEDVPPAFQPPTARVASLINEIPVHKLNSGDLTNVAETAAMLSDAAAKIEKYASITGRTPKGAAKLDGTIKNTQDG